MVVVEGYMKDVKNAIMAHIAAAHASLTPLATHVLDSWEQDVWTMDPDNLPIVTVRVGPATTQDVAYGRILKGATTQVKGTYTIYFFTAHVYDTVPASGGKNDDAMDTAELIKTKLLKSADSASGIVFYDRITLREAISRMHKVAKVILEGYIYVRRPHT